jgi:hypothetical protein
LYCSAASFISLVFAYIDRIFPPQHFFEELFLGELRWSVSSLMVMFPLYLFLTAFLAKECRAQPEKSSLRIRRALIFFTLFIIALVALKSLALLIYIFLGNDLSVPFMLKTLALLIVTGAIFLYYLRDLKQSWTRSQLRWLAGGLSVVVIATLGYGVFLVKTAPPKPLLTIPARRSFAVPTPGMTNFPRVKIAYCQGKGLAVTPQEDKLIQPLVNNFSAYAGCEAGNNCLVKYNGDNSDSVKFSIAWKTQCGLNVGVGDNGHGSTFVCQHYPNNRLCCSSLGFSDEICA